VAIADDAHYAMIAEMLGSGLMIPFLGAGANLCDRHTEVAWNQGSAFLPNGYELAGHLAARGGYPVRKDLDLLRVSQYVDSTRGENLLYVYLREVFGPVYEPTSVHRLLARLARLLEQRALDELLVVTTNYDDLVERAFRDEGLEFDVVWYEAKQGAPEGAHGRFVHKAPGAKPEVIVKPNEYRGLPEKLVRPAILKLHGCLVRDGSPRDDSYVITEDSYIEYLSTGDVVGAIPIALADRMTNNSLLFLGYSLSDWNLRVVLNRIWGARKLQAKSWAVQREPRDSDDMKIEEALWADKNRPDIVLIYCELKEYVKGLEARLPLAAPAAQSG